MPKKNEDKVRIKINNWHKYQPEMEDESRRVWVAISAHLFHDPEFMSLDLCERVAWVGLLCHACIKGPVFDLSPSFARVLWGLYRTPDFGLLEKQGFITLITDKTDRQDRQTRQTRPSKPTRTPEEEQRLAELKAIYPKREGSQPWPRALKAANARMKAGATWSELLDGVRLYAEFCRLSGDTGTRFVLMAATFFGPDEHFKQPWDPPQNKADRRQDRTVEAGHTWLENNDEQKR